MIKHSLVLIYCVTFLTQATADELQVFPKGNVACSITVQGNSAPAEPVRFPKKADVSRVGANLHLSILWSDQKTSEAWQPGKLDLTLSREQGREEIGVRRGDSGLPVVFHLDAHKAWIDWMGSDCLIGEADYKGFNCNHYKKQVQIPLSDGTTATALYQAWLDQKTGMIVAFDDEDARYEFEFKTPPSHIAIPPVVQAQMKKYERLLSRPQPL
jgi:hypothetical protein